MELIMGIDLGSTSIKAVIYDPQGNMVSMACQPTKLSYPDSSHPSWSVWDPNDIWDSVCETVRQALEPLADKTHVRVVAVTGFGMDGLPISSAGESLYPLISWHCPRTNDIAQTYSDRVGQLNIFKESGAQMMTIHSIYRMMWMKQNHPEILDKTDKWLLIEDFVNFKLCGEKATDFSMAWNTSVLDQKNKRWSENLISEAGIPERIFPDIRQSGSVLGNVTKLAAEQTGLSPSTSVVLGGHDYICAALAVGAVNNDAVMDVTGTWEMVLQASDVLSHDEKIFNSGYYVENHVAKDRYCFVASTVCGDMTEWFKDNLSHEERYIQQQHQCSSVWEPLMKNADKASVGANGCFFLPHFSGAGSPIMDPHSMGAYIGLSNIVTKNDLIRATIEGLDYQFCHMVEALENALSISPGKIIAVGGATKNSFWMQNKADVCGKLIEVPDLYEATPLGAAMLAGIGVGIYKDEADAIMQVKRPSTSYEPDQEKYKQYSEYYNEIYKKIYDSLREVNHRISKRFRACNE